VGLGYIPVVSPISIQRGARAAECGGLLNVNADTVAVETALALRARHLIYLTDVPGVKDREGRVVSNLSLEEADKLIVGGIIEGGMIPKVEACLKASQASIQSHVLDGRKPNNLLKALEDGGTGTRFS
jgi:acetylglutamate kinase